ncbi:MAG TPA: hypothetical protein VHI52_19685 [Verrucomicrobiae bacterium]|nr:hypothetical protein [Verrucomicrobiae bacterium]
MLNESRPTRALAGPSGWLPLIVAAALAVLLCGLTGCVSKATAQAQARAAFLAGQQQALERLQQTQPHGPTVTFIGEVRNNLIPWTADLTLAKALVAAQYYGATDPGVLIVTRDNQPTRVDPKQLLNGNDMLLLPGDVVEIRH